MSYFRCSNPQCDSNVPPRFLNTVTVLQFDKMNDRIRYHCLKVLDSSITGISTILTAFTYIAFFFFQGGKHVDYVADQIVNIIKPLIDKNLKNGIKKVVVKNHLCVFVNALIENPAFSSQTKDVLTTSVSDFGSKCAVDVTAITEWAERIGLVEDLTSDGLSREGRPARKPRKPAVAEDLSDIVKLEDANWAGNGARSEECRLLITEGDSAKALAVAGLEVVGRDRYGVFPIMGKLTNVSGLTEEKANATKEVNHLIRILGLKYGVDYSVPQNRSTLRYGGVIILTDQDEDGSHIKGLIINFLHTFWPQLLRGGFVQCFMTPLLKARRGPDTISFYSMNEFTKWKETTTDADKYTIKYYKGLGTSTSKEAREYFSNFEKHLVQFRHEDDDDDLRIRLVFDKRRSDDRKQWISERLLVVNQESAVDVPSTNETTYKEFVDNELFRYSLLDLRRSIPSVVDGLKPSQRKVIHALLRRRSNKEIKVNQLAAAVALSEAYHHGEASLVTTIVRLAQDFVGMNNVCLLEPLGQFGTRHGGGDDAASARYIYTKLTPLTRLIFPPSDDELLNYLEEENQSIEPEWYCPIIPMILVNGAEGIATGWSTRVLSHDISKVIDNVRRLIEQDELAKMVPSFSDFSGNVREVEENRFEIRGKFTVPSQRKNASSLSIEIVELPVGEWTNRYKQNILHPLQTKGLISSFKEYHTERRVRFVLELSKEFSARCRRQTGRYGELMKTFKLISTVSSNSMVLFDPHGHLKHYTTVFDIMREHFHVRRRKYEERKEYETRMLDAQRRRLENQLRFVEATISGDVRPHGKHLSELESDMRSMGFEDDPVQAWKNEAADLSYLINMPLSRLTVEEVEKLQNQVQTSRDKLDNVIQTSWQDSWLADLQVLERVGPVEKLSVTDKNSYRFAMVTFEDEESVPFAVETLDGIKLFKIPLTVKPRNGSKHDRRNSDSVRRESYGSSHSSPYSESRKRDHMGRTMSYDERLNRSYSASRSETNLMFTPPVPPPPPPPPPLPPHSDSYPSLKTRSSMPNDKYNTPKSSYTGRLPGGDQRRTFPSKPSDTRVFEDS
ncbi:DNA topoisomerase 2 [Trichostrongylus colubriformis]|uniref:DNA topoisomerase 2 n=1 Tax=Trichostrongylus colubriformis TaxID=6319 RepID=A0AAN8FP78_TRICO